MRGGNEIHRYRVALVRWSVVDVDASAERLADQKGIRLPRGTGNMRAAEVAVAGGKIDARVLCDMAGVERCRDSRCVDVRRRGGAVCMMRFASLGSGSRGNALVVEAQATRVMVDCGFSLRTTVERLARLGLAPQDISAILITHEHSDHVAGVRRFAARYDVPVYLTHGTLLALGDTASVPLQLRVIDGLAPLGIGDLQVQAITVPHDAREPVQYAFTDGAHRLGVMTDVGTITPHIVDSLQSCHALVLECNHDAGLLAASRYPAMLKRRIQGQHGHLENAQAAALLACLEKRALQHVIAAHLSAENNRPELAEAALAGVLGCSAGWVGVADQQTGFGWREIV